MGVLAKIAKPMLRTAEGAFRVNHPWGAEQRPKPRCESLGILKCGEGSVEAEFVLRVQLLEAIHEFAPEHFFENVDRQEELPLRVDPSRVVRRARPPAGTRNGRADDAIAAHNIRRTRGFASCSTTTRRTSQKTRKAGSVFTRTDLSSSSRQNTALG